MLIIGYGGYVRSTVIPACRKLGIPIQIISKNPVNTVNAAAIHNLKCPESFDDAIENNSEILLALPPTELAELLQIIPKTKKIWIEKPISELCVDAYKEIKDILDAWNAPVYVGMLKRGALSLLREEPFEKILISLNVDKDLGWRANIQGGELWADGIHAYDLAYQLVGFDAKVQDLKFSENSIQFLLIEKNTSVQIKVGNFENKLIVDGKDKTELLDYKSSITFMSEMLNKWINGESNFESCISTQQIIMKKIYGLRP